MSSHQISAIPRPKMDTPTGLFTWACTCGRTGSMIGSESDALRAGESHRAAKERIDPTGAVRLVISQHDALIVPQTFTVMSGDIIRIDLTAIVEGTKPEDFWRITLPVVIQANLA